MTEATFNFEFCTWAMGCEDSAHSVGVHVDEDVDKSWGKFMKPVDGVHRPGGNGIVCLSAVIVGDVYFLFVLFSIFHDEGVGYDSVNNAAERVKCMLCGVELGFHDIVDAFC